VIHVLLPVLLAALRTSVMPPARSLTALHSGSASRRRRGHGVTRWRRSQHPGRGACRRARLPPCAHDGTERRIVRPQDPPEQTECYSGKKRDHTVKMFLLVNALLVNPLSQ